MLPKLGYSCQNNLLLCGIGFDAARHPFHLALWDDITKSSISKI
uniref:Uncharacterized protein n=1 Tax=Arundo donax TaxID=35708 RepID=A0A0A8Z8W1_ARUDO